MSQAPNSNRPRWRPERIAWLLDSAFRVPGTRMRFGLDPLIGLLFPGAGDVLAGLLAVSLVFRSVRHGLPSKVIAQMLFNIGVDTLAGSVPVIGDLFDFVWKSNEKNLQLFREHTRQEYIPSRADRIWAMVLLAGFVLLLLVPAILLLFLLRSAGFRLI